jgi:hypothetical protein
MDFKASTFYTIEPKMSQRNTFSPHLPLKENPKLNLNGILPPFEVGGQDGAILEEAIW